MDATKRREVALRVARQTLYSTQDVEHFIMMTGLGEREAVTQCVVACTGNISLEDLSAFIVKRRRDESAVELAGKPQARTRPQIIS